MKKSQILLLFAFLIVSVSGYSQSVKFKKGNLLVDGNEWLKYEDCGTFDSVCSIMNLEGDEIIFIKTVRVDGAEPRTSSNPQGVLSYYEISFLGTDRKIELQRTQKKVMTILYNEGVVNNGQLDIEKVDRLVEKYGTEFSDRLNQSNSTQTIIIKEEPKKSGVNINIGG